jgi:putative ABC transport system substrate-binding protein
MDRRHFAAVLLSTASWPFMAAAQQPARMRRLGLIMAAGRTPEYVDALADFEELLGSLGWKRGDNLLIEERWSAGSHDDARSAAKEVLALNPDIIVAQSATVVEALLAETSTTPIVFLHVADPVGSGFVASLARPRGNVTGVTNTEPSIGGKWLQLLKEIAPTVRRCAMLANPDTQRDRGALFLDPFETAARSLDVTTVTGEVRDIADVQRVFAELAEEPGGGVVVIPDAFFASHSGELVELVADYRLPAIYPYRYYVQEGGLICYGVNNSDLFRQAAPYVDRILRGTDPGELPVQQPTRFELAINMKTARSLALTVSPMLMVQADEVID